MDKLIKVLQLLVIITILGLLIWFIFFRSPGETQSLKNQAREYWENPKFETDTVVYQVDYSKLPKPIFKNYVPPAQILQYIDSTYKDMYRLEIRKSDSLLLLTNRLTGERDSISRLYITQFISASKLIYGSFKSDTLTLDLLGIDGSLITSVYPVNYARFSYQYRDGRFLAQPNKPKKVVSNFNGVLYGYAGYAFTSKAPNIGLDYSLSKGKIRLQANTFITVEQSPEFYLGLNAGYKLYGSK